MLCRRVREPQSCVDANVAVLLRFVLMMQTRLFTVQVEPKHVGGPLGLLRFMRYAAA